MAWHRYCTVRNLQSWDSCQLYCKVSLFVIFFFFSLFIFQIFTKEGKNADSSGMPAVLATSYCSVARLATPTALGF